MSGGGDGSERPEVLELTYAGTHGLYRKAGWSGVLPLPPGSKYPPPDGFTGWHGLDPSGSDSQDWIDNYPEYRGTGQLALRMPATAIGIDVDHYGDKRGADTMAEAMRRWGPIPIGAHSSARGDGAAGIWFYRIPKGATLKTRIAFPELGLGHIEIIQRHHRYAVVWPSIHPETGQRYEWYGAQLAEGLLVPRLQDMPALPERWLEALAGADDPGVSAADPATVAEFAKRYATGTEPGALRGVLATWERESTTSARHDAMLSAVCMAAREARMGRYSAADARAQLRQAFTLALAEAKPGQRLAGPDVARREFDSMWAWGVSAALQESEDELALRRDRAQAGTAADPMTRPSADDFWADEGELPRPPGNAPAVAEPAAGGEQGGYVTDAAGTVFTGDEEELTPEQLAEHQYRLEVAAKVRSLRIADEARELLRLETAAAFETLSWDEFLDSPQPERLVAQLLYRDGTSKVFGPPGSTKSFFVLDLALSMATGTPWRGMTLPRTRVHYVMAEGRSVNVGRTHAWLHQRGVPRDAARGWFTAVPQGVLLTEQGVRRYADKVMAEQPGWIILDTKNRMMVGNENDGSDVGVMVRALDSIRLAAGVECNVTLIDHTGLNDTTRGRGSNAVEAAMDTEIKVVCEAGIATVEVTRDKNAEPGHRLSYRLEPVTAIVGPDGKHPAVVVPCDDQEAVVTFGHPDDWQQDHPALPSDILEYRGDGYGAVKELARFMRARARGDIGVSRLEARQAVMERYPAIKKDTIYRAWSALVELNRLSPDKASDPIGRAHWASFDDDPAMP